MEDADIRAVMKRLGVARGVPAGYVRVWQTDLAARGYDTDEVAAWVLRHEGRVDAPHKQADPTFGRTRWRREIETAPRSYIVPVAALDPHGARR